VTHQATKATPDDHANLLALLHNLGSSLESRYNRTGAMDDLNKAIQVAHQAIKATPDDHPKLAGWLNTLGNHLESRYERTGAIDDLEEAIRVARQAIKAMPDHHPHLAACLNNLGNKLGCRYERTGAMDDLEEAIRVARQAIKATPNYHPDLAGFLNNLGDRLRLRYERTGAMDDVEEATRVLEHAWRCKNATPFVRVRACTQALRLLQSQQHFESAYRLAVDAIDLLSYIHNRSLGHQDQQYVVSYFSGLATTACSLALHTGKGPEAALEVLERGRGVILRLLIDNRSNTSKLEVAHPEACARYKSLLLEVNKVVEDITDDRTRMATSRSRIEALATLEECVHDI
jgi:tetratricopeptide (TPR) repeat protein